MKHFHPGSGVTTCKNPYTQYIHYILYLCFLYFLGEYCTTNTDVKYERNMSKICEKSALQWVAQQIWLRKMGALRVWSRFAVEPKQCGAKMKCGRLQNIWMKTPRIENFRNIDEKMDIYTSKEYGTHLCQ